MTTIKRPKISKTEEIIAEMLTENTGVHMLDSGGTSGQSLCEKLPEAGGVIGPLPDGYVIDVRRVTWTELATLTGFYSAPQYDNEREELIDAYNNKD